MTSERRNDIDWLRIFAVYLLFIYHTAKIFDATPFMHIKNSQISSAMCVFTWSVKMWHMPLFFLLAGWAISGSLKNRGATRFAKERLRRLLVPFLAGCLLLCPVMVFLEHKAQRGFSMTFLQFLPHFYTSMDYFSWSHLWFLIYLMTFTLLYFPLFYLLGRKKFGGGNSILWVYLPVIPLVLIQITLRERWPGFQNLYDDWANFAFFSCFLILGFLLAEFPEYERTVHRHWRVTLPMGLLAMVFADFVNMGQMPQVGWALVGIAGYFTVMGLLGFARRYLSFDARPLAYLRESAFPVYILHQPGIVIPGFFIIALPLGIAAKYAITLAFAVVITMSAYHFAFRGNPVSRFLLGMKTAAPVAPAPAEDYQVAAR